MFEKILIANRGEIACRVIKTARRMGVSTVAVFSEADERALHVRMADEAVLIGPAAARESYLKIERIVAAARRTGAEAIHPGYGFLAENDAFADACQRSGLVFIGPPVAAISAMGSKASAKVLAERAGLPLIPGYHGEDQDPERLRTEAGAIGYPVLIKAAAGGGGKGMRTVERPEDFPGALASCRREAISSFGDDRVVVEKFLHWPRHVEVQVFADNFGNCIHLFERDCSVQRRHQKVVEEAPAPGLQPEQRAAMGEAAVAAARAVNYRGAGTVEFLTDSQGNFYFMEMNTRLQVEHPVTEMITGLDLVEWQLLVAAGEPLPLTQDQVPMTGHAIEARIYAEDPQKAFLPSSGKLLHLALPAESPHVRLDSGVEQGDEITPFYDPLIAKLIVWDIDRDGALTRLKRALGECRVAGVANNVEFLSRLAASPAFAGGDINTGLLGRESPFLLRDPADPPPEVYAAAAVAGLLREADRVRAEAEAAGEPNCPWLRLDGWRLGGPHTSMLRFRAGTVVKEVAVEYRAAGFLLTIDQVAAPAWGAFGANDTLRFEWNGRAHAAAVIFSGDKRLVFLQGRSDRLTVINPLHPSGESSLPDTTLAAPMPGRVVALLVESGAAVGKGTGLVVLESMKMEITLVAPADGKVRAFPFAVGDLVPEGAEVVAFDRKDAATSS